MQLQILDSHPELTWAQKLAYLTVELNRLEQSETPVKHLFEGDMYIREMTIPKDTLFIGRTHLRGHLVQLVSGKVLNITPTERFELKAPFEVHSVPGYQATFITLTDVVGRTVHPNPEGLTDTQILEDRDFETLAQITQRGESVRRQLLLQEVA